MSSQSPAQILINSVIKTIGKREFLKTVETMFPKQTPQVKQKSKITEEHQCQARVKGERTGCKVGRHVLFESARCDRKEISSDTHLCAIHTNKVKKNGSLPYGMASEPLTEEQQKVFAL